MTWKQTQLQVYILLMEALDADFERYIFNSSFRAHSFHLSAEFRGSASYGKGLGGERYMSDRELSSDAADVMDVVRILLLFSFFL